MIQFRNKNSQKVIFYNQKNICHRSLQYVDYLCEFHLSNCVSIDHKI